MHVTVQLYSNAKGEIKRFLSSFFNNINIDLADSVLHWTHDYPNPIELVDFIGAYIENIDSYNISMWISIDNGVFIKVTCDNSDELIRYLYERFPY